MAYRDESDPLRIQEKTLAVELAQLQKRERVVADALADTRATLEERRSPPAKRGRAWGIVVVALAWATGLFLCIRVCMRAPVDSSIGPYLPSSNGGAVIAPPEPQTVEAPDPGTPERRVMWWPSEQVADAGISDVIETCKTDEDCMLVVGCCAPGSVHCPGMSVVVNRAHVEEYAAAHACPALEPCFGGRGLERFERPLCGEKGMCELAVPGPGHQERSFSDEFYSCSPPHRL